MMSSLPTNERLQEASARYYLRLSTRIKAVTGRGLPGAGFLIANSEHKWTHEESPSMPDASILDITYATLVSVDEFESLRRGVARLVGRYPSRWGLHGLERFHEKWFAPGSGRFPGSWLNGGHLDFKDSVKHRGFFTWGDLGLVRVSSSTICLTLSLVPSAEFKSKLSQILSEEYLPKTKVTAWSLRRGPVGFGTIDAYSQRYHRVNALFLEAKRLATGMLRKCTSGRSETLSPTVCIETYTTPEIKATGRVKLASSFSAAFGTRYDPFQAFHDRNSIIFFPEREALPSARGRYRFLIEHASTADDRSRHDLRFGIVYDFHRSIAPILAMTLGTDFVARQIDATRSRLARALMRRRLFSVHRVGTAFRQLMRLQSMQYAVDRMYNEITADDQARYLYGIREFLQLDRLGDSDITLTDVVKRHLDLNQKFIAAELDTLTSLYRDWTNYRTSHVNYRIQLWVFVLTVLAIILTVLQFVPDEALQRGAKGFLGVLREYIRF